MIKIRLVCTYKIYGRIVSQFRIRDIENHLMLVLSHIYILCKIEKQPHIASFPATRPAVIMLLFHDLQSR
jgi:hypothetical protein